MSEIVFFSGLPRSFSTGLANILAMHPDIKATPSSPICEVVQGMRNHWSTHEFLQAQLEHNPDVQERFASGIRAFIQAYLDSDKRIVLDKNRAWMALPGFLKTLYPNFKLIITLRDLRGIVSSIEKQHAKTPLLLFKSGLHPDLVLRRVHELFSENGTVGGPLRWLMNLQHFPGIEKHVFIFRYENFLKAPNESVEAVFNWLGVEPVKIDFKNIVQSTHESDSHYNLKYSHKVKPEFEAPENYPVSPAILEDVHRGHAWYYHNFYNERDSTNKG